MPKIPPRRCLSVLALSGLLLGLAGPSGQDAPQRPPFRAAVAMVPVNVSVVGRDGKPVLDLKKEDFTILEDGVRQEVGHFSLERLEADPSVPGVAEAVARRNVPVLELAPQERRVFLVVLATWRGATIQEPNKALDALQDFVRQQLLPQDTIALIAYNRATVFTANHAAIAEVVARFRARSEEIGASLEMYFSGERARFGSGRIPDDIQNQIDGVFDVPGASMRQLPAADRRPLRTNLMPPRPTITDTPESLGDRERAFEAMVSRSLHSSQALSQLMAGIQYMRTMEGQKRLVYIGPTVSAADNLAAMANDARVALDMIQAGGIEGLPIVRGMVLTRTSALGDAQSAANFRRLAQQTGGQAFTATFTKPALARVDAVTRTQYLLGYYPKNTDWNGKYREIEVKVKRANVETVWRQGYYARRADTPYDAQELFTATRISSAARFQKAVPDIKLKAEVSDAVATVTIDVSKVRFEKVDDKLVARLSVAVFFGNARQQMVDERWNTINLTFTEKTYRQYLTTGVEYRYPIPVNLKPTFMKVVVYNYDTDLLGSVENDLRTAGR